MQSFIASSSLHPSKFQISQPVTTFPQQHSHVSLSFIAPGSPLCYPFALHVPFATTSAAWPGGQANVNKGGRLSAWKRFSAINPIKIKKCNLLDKHLALCVHMFTQQLLTLDTFPFRKAVEVCAAKPRVFDAEALHRSCYSMAVEELGIAHPLSSLTRANLIEALMVQKAWEPAGSLNVKVADQEQQGQECDSKEEKVDMSEARQLLQAALSQLKAEAEILKVAAANPSALVGKGIEGLTQSDGFSSDQCELTATALYCRTCIATVRTYIELGRLEMEAGEDLAAAEDAYRAAVELCDEVYGADSRESQGTASSLANCLRAAGKKEEARVLYERLYDLTFKRNGCGEATAVHLAQSLADLAEEARGLCLVFGSPLLAFHSVAWPQFASLSFFDF
ncbi:hypothetical protein VOLCADRAFT_99516 [Volvox carteri f. nagariensis]|uniref:Uncharacterized protein n=1 Tax=Volvox carteri f. nagariensis TaxID=3068 RepID=D8UHZ2_VOLCA|nr:uncharacterized protein VOLCADRAFT_99516 [Volvox carteri f. nagariensis]EFJ40664.1 hypothetical protein VOLCADRAFT_99516 [Volvox carteri f. nagariensis]|eukprot:XP_002958290.1 hypothetical protein VOLCADRAFT_99516 [Volvox carteri f. nagariensis]